MNKAEFLASRVNIVVDIKEINDYRTVGVYERDLHEVLCQKRDT